MPTPGHIAPYYDALAKLVFGQSIHKAQIHYLDLIPNNARILILGGGTGWILDEISDQTLHIDYVDTSAKMLDFAKNRQTAFATLQFIQGNEDSVTDQSYDVVITPFVLDICTHAQLPVMVAKIKRNINTNGHWLCIDFNVYDNSFKAQLLSNLMRYFFRLTSGLQLKSLLPYFDAINQAGFKEISSAFYYGRFIQASWFQQCDR